jgi:hypothetical protein
LIWWINCEVFTCFCQKTRREKLES